MCNLCMYCTSFGTVDVWLTTYHFLYLQGDCCNSNFTRVGKNCINASKEMMNYDQAKRNCSEMGSQVIEFENGQELNEVCSEFANTVVGPLPDF